MTPSMADLSFFWRFAMFFFEPTLMIFAQVEVQRRFYGSFKDIFAHS